MTIIISKDRKSKHTLSLMGMNVSVSLRSLKSKGYAAILPRASKACRCLGFRRERGSGGDKYRNGRMCASHDLSGRVNLQASAQF
jgi:hypothetical protein